MAIRTILTDEDPILRKRCHPVTKFDQKLGDLLDDLRETLSQAEGMGLAAPQVGILRRVAIVCTEDGEETFEMVNPEVVEQRGEEEGLEGCLSVPGLWGYVKRPTWVRIKAQDRHGKEVEYVAEGLTARCFCHEISHLDGHLYTELCQRLYTAEEVEAMEDQKEQKDPGGPKRQKKKVRKK